MSSLRADPEHAVRRAQLGVVLASRYGLSGEPADLDAGIVMLSDAMPGVPHDEFGRVIYLMTLSDALRLRFELTGEMTALDQAVSYGAEAVSAAPSGLPDRAAAVSNNGNALLERGTVRGVLADLDEAIDLFHLGIDVSAPGHVTRAMCDGNLSPGATRPVQFGPGKSRP